MAIVIPTTAEFVELIQPKINQFVATLTLDQLTFKTSFVVARTLSRIIMGDTSKTQDLDNSPLSVAERQYWTNYLTVIKIAMADANFTDCSNAINDLINKVNGL